MPTALGMESVARSICLSVKALKAKQASKEVNGISSSQYPSQERKSVSATFKKVAVKYFCQKLAQKRVGHVRTRYLLTERESPPHSCVLDQKTPEVTDRGSWNLGENEHIAHYTSLTADKSARPVSCDAPSHGDRGGNGQGEGRARKSWGRAKSWLKAGVTSAGLRVFGAGSAQASVGGGLGGHDRKVDESVVDLDDGGHGGGDTGGDGSGSGGEGGEGGFEGAGDAAGMADAASSGLSPEEDEEQAEKENSGVPWLRPVGQHFFASLANNVKIVPREEALRDKSKGGAAATQDEAQNTVSSEPRKAGEPALGQQHHRSMIGMDSPIDWLAGLMHTLVAERVGGQGKSCVTAIQSALHDQAGLITETAKQVVEILSEQEGDGAFAHRSEVQALKRLQRETFNELLRVKDRLDKVEHHTGLRKIKLLGDSLAVMKTRMRGEVGVGVAMVPVEELGSRHSRNTLEQAGLRAGVDVKFTFETPFRERDLLITQASSADRASAHPGGPLGGPLSLDKIMYTAHLTEELVVKVAPLGALGSDIAEQTLNPLQGQGLTRFSSGGVALFQECKGTAAAVTLRNNSGVSLTAAQFLGGWGDHMSDMGMDAPPSSSSEGPLCASTLANITLQPHSRFLLSFSALNRFWPTPPLPTDSGVHWSEMGPLVIPKLWASKSGSSTSPSPQQSAVRRIGGSSLVPAASCEPDSHLNSFLPKGTAMQSLAVAGAIDVVGRATIGGWAQMERADWLQENERKKVQWAVVMARAPSSAGRFSWGLSVGASQPDMWRPVHSELGDGMGETSEEVAEQLQMEAFLRINCGKGFTVQPGAVFVTDHPFSGGKYSTTPAWMLRSSWNI